VIAPVTGADEPAPPTAADGTVLSGLALARAEVDRCAHLRTDDGWLAAAWADPRTRVLAVEQGRALGTVHDDGASIAFIAPAQAPEGVRFLLGVDDDAVA
jgi:NAD+ diphosphatase